LLPAADVGAQVHVLLEDQSCITVHVLPSNTNHLKCTARCRRRQCGERDSRPDR
jgi:hypothetical protein